MIHKGSMAKICCSQGASLVTKTTTQQLFVRGLERIPRSRCGTHSLTRTSAYRPSSSSIGGYQEGVVRLDVSNKKGSQQTVSVVIPLNYANMLGLKGRDLYLDPIINSAYDELFHQALNPGYSAIAKLGKEKLLFAAREALRSVKGRVSLVHPDVTIEPVLLPGTMALLNQLGHYELVLQLSEQVKNISPRDLKATNKGTMRDYQQDVSLAAALAHCGLARDALEGGSVSLGYARLEEAFTILDKNGGQSLSPDLYSDISRALVDLKLDAVVDTLREPLDLGQVTNRQSAIAAFVSMLKSSQPGVTPEFVSKVLSHMTSIEIMEAMDWSHVSASNSKNPWYTGDIAMYIGVAHLVAGFAYRRPFLVAKARRIFGVAHAMQADVSIPLAVSEILLGETSTAIGILLEDERLGLKLRGAARMDAGQRNTKAYPAETLPERDEVMGYIRFNSGGSSTDILPGVCLFVQLWLSSVAFPRIRDTKERPISPSLSDYFDAPGTSKYLTSKSKGFGDIVGSILGFLKQQSVYLFGVPRMSNNIAKSVQYMAGLPKSAITTINTPGVKKNLVNMVTAALGLYVFVQLYGVIVSRSSSVSSSAPGLSEKAPKSKKKSTQKRTSASKAVTKSSSSMVMMPILDKDDAKDIIETWLDIKADAMGPRHTMQQLSSILADPMLSAVTSEAKEASRSGWFWNIRPQKVRVEDVANQQDGSVLVIATVDESADLWATNGKKGDSYKTSYKVEYTLVQEKNSTWKISSALVIGK